MLRFGDKQVAQRIDMLIIVEGSAKFACTPASRCDDRMAVGGDAEQQAPHPRRDIGFLGLDQRWWTPR